MKKIVLLAALCGASTAWAIANDIPSVGYGTATRPYFSGGIPAGGVATRYCSQAAGDTTPSMGGGLGGCNILLTNTANGVPTAITTLDDTLVGVPYGELIYVVGRPSAANPTTIANGGAFELEGNWSAPGTGERTRILVLEVTTAGFFKEVSRSGGPRTWGETSTGDCTWSDDNGLQGCSRLADAAPNEVLVTGQAAWYGAAANTTGGDLVLAGGLGVRKLAMTAVNCAGDTITVSINGTMTTGTEGVNFNCAALTNAQCATNVASWINGLTGVDAVANVPTSGTAYVYKDVSEPGAVTLGLMTSDATCAAITRGEDGTTLVRGAFWADAGTRSNDAATSRTVFLRSENPYGGATGGNNKGADLYLGAGGNQLKLTAVSNLAGAVTLTFYYNAAGRTGTVASVALASGVDFTLGVNDTAPELAVTATNLANAINAHVTLGTVATAASVGPAVYVNTKNGKWVSRIDTSLSGAISRTNAGAGQAWLLGTRLSFWGSNTSSDATTPALLPTASSLNMSAADGVTGSYLRFASNRSILFSSTADPQAAQDTGIVRYAANTIALTNGSTTNAGGLVGGTINMAGTVKTTDTLPGTASVIGEGAYSQASSGANRLGGPLHLYGGDGSMFFTFVANVGALTLTFYNNNVSIATMIAGTNFAYGGDTSATATNLANAINASGTLNVFWTANAVANVVYLQRKAGIQNLIYPSITSSDAGICTTNRSAQGNVYTTQLYFTDGTSAGGGPVTGYGNQVAVGATAGMLLTATSANYSLANGGALLWSSTITGAGSKDTGLKRSAAGVVAATNGSTGAGKFQSQTATILDPTVDSYLALTNAAGTDFTGLQFGGATSSFPMIKRSATNLQCRTADDSAWSPVNTNAVTPGTISSDAVPSQAVFAAQNVYPQAAVNTTGSAVYLSAGHGVHKFTVVNHDNGVTTLTFYRSTSTTNITGASDTAFICSTGAGAATNDICATNLANWINGHGTLSAEMTAAAVTNVVYLTKKDPVGAIALASSVVGTISVSVPSNGSVYVAGLGLRFADELATVTTINPNTSPGIQATAQTNLSIRSGVSLGTQGTLQFGRVVNVNATTPVTVGALSGNSVWTNEGATAQVNYNLPTASAGYHYTWIVQDADGIRITASAGDTIRIAGTVTAAAGYIESATIGDSVTLQSINATEWVATSVIGTWSFGP